MRRLKAKAISTAMTFFWAVQAFGAEPKTEKIEVMLDIPANPFLDQVCVIANYLTIGAIICSIVFGGIWLMQKKDSSDEEDDDDNEEEVRAPVGSMAKVVNETPEIVKVEKPADETKAEEPKVEEPKVEEPKAEEPPTEVTKTEETTAEELKPEEKAPAASKSKKAENDGTAKKPRKSKKKE
ncbi:MAG: hypothetical protein IPG59_05780 [Candidatus Melainabacteria bacterium]|nr:MAG: hypothetical protein IPG59_05780 [Candidatus Melainabacteria bacterium]